MDLVSVWELILLMQEMKDRKPGTSGFLGQTGIDVGQFGMNVKYQWAERHGITVCFLERNHGLDKDVFDVSKNLITIRQDQRPGQDGFITKESNLILQMHGCPMVDKFTTTQL